MYIFLGSCPKTSQWPSQFALDRASADLQNALQISIQIVLGRLPKNMMGEGHGDQVKFRHKKNPTFL
jgi:hypothetical protein